MERTKLRLGPEDRGRAMTLEEFADADADPGWRYELSGGVVEVVEIPGLPHGQVLFALDRQLFAWAQAHPGVIRYHASGDRCALRLPGARSERHPDLALYLSPAPDPVNPWDRWIPEIVVEVVSEGSEARDYEDKRREYLAAGVREYWILDPTRREGLFLQRTGDVFREHRSERTWSSALLPGFVLDVAGVWG